MFRSSNQTKDYDKDNDEEDVRKKFSICSFYILAEYSNF